MANDLPEELDTELIKHEHWQGHDFRTAQILLWLGILASGVSAAIAAGVASLPKPISAFIAAIPGVIILIDKTFKYAARSSWHSLYGIRLRALKREIRDRNAPIAEVSERLGKLEEEMESLFPPLDSGLLAKKRSD